MYLADLGARVLKIEAPSGDDSRGWGPPFVDADSAWFWSANRNKESAVVDLRTPEGRKILDLLLAESDVLIESLNPAKLAQLGLDPESVRSRYPSLVYCAVSGFGLTGPHRLLAGYDLIAQARSGMMSVTGERGGRPQRVSTALSDVVTGLIASLAIVAAIRRAERTGVGDLVDVSLLDSDLALMAPRIASYLAGEPEPAPSGGTDSVIAVYQPFQTADQPIVVAAGSDRIWRRFCGVVGLEPLLENPGLADNAGRVRERARLTALIQAELLLESSDVWLQRFADAQVPAARVQSLSEVVADPQVEARNAIVEMSRADGTSANVVGSPWRMDFNRDGIEVALPPPRAGEHTETILAEHGFTAAEIRALLHDGVVWSADAEADAEPDAGPRERIG
jgi:crotonobetainyl-CoA:carnitine CoA-transferase CaiB-like acyl-CoA transferase